MKLTKSKLKQIIKEELNKVMREIYQLTPHTGPGEPAELDAVLSSLELSPLEQKGFKYVIKRLKAYSLEQLEKTANQPPQYQEDKAFSAGMKKAIAAAQEFEKSEFKARDPGISFIDWLKTKSR